MSAVLLDLDQIQRALLNHMLDMVARPLENNPHDSVFQIVAVRFKQVWKACNAVGPLKEAACSQSATGGLAFLTNRQEYTR